ncbi:MAG: hypothetical protein ACK559_07025, partial [bacterium]
MTHVYDDGGLPYLRRNIRVDLRDEDGLHEEAGVFYVDVINAVPTLTVTAPSNLVSSQSFNVSIVGADASQADYAAGFRFEIDWNNDGTYDYVNNQGLQNVSVPY